MPVFNCQMIVDLPSIVKNSVPYIGLKLTYILYLPLRPTLFVIATNSVLACKVNKVIIIPFLRIGINGRVVLLKITVTGMRSCTLRSRERTEYPSVPNRLRLAKRKQVWYPLPSFHYYPLLQPQTLPERMWCV